MRELVEATGISHGTVISIARIIGYEKVIGKMPRLFTVDHKRDHDDFKTMFGDVST